MKERQGTLFSGIQPTGEIHIGNYIGAIRNWVDLMEEYRCIYSIVDYHAITVPYDPRKMPDRVIETAISCLSCGIDPEKSIFFIQSMVPEHTELAWILGTLTNLGELSRMTQFKEKAKGEKGSAHLGLFSYPVLQAADILLYKAGIVPVGEDQIQHLELSREIVRRFNRTFGEVFPEPSPFLGKVRKILGLDGNSKMSKSLGNHISLSEGPDLIRGKLATAVTDTARKRRTDPGNPELCNLFTLHRFFSGLKEQERVREGCISAGIGCLECKAILSKNMIEHLAPIRERMEDLRQRRGEVIDILASGANRAKRIAASTLQEVREVTGIGLPKDKKT